MIQKIIIRITIRAGLTIVADVAAATGHALQSAPRLVSKNYVWKKREKPDNFRELVSKTFFFTHQMKNF